MEIQNLELNNTVLDPNITYFQVDENGKVIQIGFQPQGDDEKKLAQLLKDFKLESLFQVLKDQNLTYHSLQYLSKEDIRDAIPNIGLRAEFREKLFFWRKQQFGKDDETISLNSKIGDWQKISDCATTSYWDPRNSKINLRELLNSTSKGKHLLQVYENNKGLENIHREGLVQLITEEVICTNVCLKPSDYPNIVNQIIAIFPTEKKVEDYYFIARKGKKHPSGKLYSKYVNCRSKRSKLSECSSIATISEQSEPELDEVDDSIAVALKTSLSRDCSDWNLVQDNWKKTFSLRQKELKQCSISNTEFLKSWPLFSDSRAPELINIDFHLLYPGKKHLLFSKWEDFKIKIQKYFEINVHNENSKRRLMILKTSQEVGKDCEDYILTTTLNSVIPPVSRFKDRSGSNKRKVTISDAQESFVLRLPLITNYKEKIEELVSKYYNVKLTIQPFIIVVGADDYSLNSFFIYLDKTLFKFDSFIEALDTCFKIFQVLSLSYPLACEPCWVLIQKIFYNIETEHDLKSPSITSLLSFLN